MSDPASPAAETDADLTLAITRVFDAPREAVFDAWIDPAQISRWIGPRSIKAEVTQMEARKDGAYRIVMHGETGNVYVVGGVYREIERPSRLVFTWAWEEDAMTHRAGHETVVTVTLRALGKKTELTLRHERFDSKQSRDSHQQGWSGSFDKLADLLAGKPGRA